MSNHKLVIVVDTHDIMPGQAATIVAEAIVELLTSNRVVSKAGLNWYNNNKNIIILSVKSEQYLLDLMVKCNKMNIDVLPYTCLEGYDFCKEHVRAIVIGPEKSSVIDKVTGAMSLYKF